MTSKRWWLVVLVTGWIVCGFAAASFAQESEALESAKRAYLEGRFEDSVRELQPLLETLEEATDLRDAHFFMGLNYLALGRDDDAMSHFESAVKQDPEFTPSPSLYSPDIIASYEEAQQSLVGRIHVVSEPPGAQVSLAGKELGQTPLERTVLAGEYMLLAELDTYTPAERAVRVRAGEQTDITLSLRAVAEPEPAETPGESESPDAPQVSTGGGGISGKTIGIIAGVGGGAAVAVAAASGGGNDGPGPTPTPTPPVVTQASISASIAPNPMSAQPSGDAQFPWRIEFDVTVRETAGLGGNVDFINIILENPATGGQTRALNYGAGEISSRAGTNHINARGSLTVPISIRYVLSGGARRAVIIAEIRFTDDRGNVLNITAEANVQ